MLQDLNPITDLAMKQPRSKAFFLLQWALVRTWAISCFVWRGIMVEEYTACLLWLVPLLLLRCNRLERVVCFYGRSDMMHVNRKLFPFARAHGRNPNSKNENHTFSFMSSLSQICPAAVFGIYDACPATPLASAMGHYERQRNGLRGPLVRANMCL